MVSVDAGNAFLRRLAIKIGVCLEGMKPKRRKTILSDAFADLQQEGRGKLRDAEDLHSAMLYGEHYDFIFTQALVGALVEQCEIIDGKRSGYPVS